MKLWLCVAMFFCVTKFLYNNRLSHKNAELIIIIIMHDSIFFSFFVWALNMKFLIIVIANLWSMILAVGTFIYIANRHKVIKLSKLCCMDSSSQFFNLRKPPENLPDSEINIYDINKNNK